MKDTEKKLWYSEFTSFFSPFNNHLPENADLSAKLLKKCQVFDPKTNSYESLFPDLPENFDDDIISEEQRKQIIDTLYNAAEKNTLAVPSEEGPVLVGIGEDGGPTKKPLNRENVEALYPPWNDGPVTKFFKRLIHGIFPNAFKEDFEKERLHDEAVRACSTAEENRDFTIRRYQKTAGISELATEKFDIVSHTPNSLVSFSMTLAYCVEGMSEHDKTEMNRSNKIQTNFALFSSSYVLNKVSKEDAKAFLTGDFRKYSPELKQVITESHREFEKTRQECFAKDKNVDYEFRDPKVSLETIRKISEIMLSEPELSSKHKVAGILAKAYGKVLQFNRNMAMSGDKINLSQDDKTMIGFAINALPTMGEVYIQSLIAEDTALRRLTNYESQAENPNAPKAFASVISRNVINAVLAENRQALSSIPPEKAGVIPRDKVTSSMNAMLSTMFTEKNMYSLVAECKHSELAADPEFMVSHIFSSPEEKLQLGNVFIKEGMKVVFDKLSKQVEPTVEINEIAPVADMESVKSQDIEIKPKEAAQETGVVKYAPQQRGMGI